MPLVLPVELPTPDIVMIVAPDGDGGDRVVVLVDPRVPDSDTDHVVGRLREIAGGPVGVRAALQSCPGCRSYALG